MALSPYYYGVQRKALTGTNYGPYYGKRYMGGRGQDETPVGMPVGTQAGMTELSEKYTAEPTAEYATEPAISGFTPTPAIRPAISGGYRGPEEAGGEIGSQSWATGTMAEANPREARNTLAWGLGLRSTPPSGFAQPTGGYKTAGQIGKVGISALTGIPGIGAIYNFGKLLGDQFLSTVLPNLYSPESLTTTEEAARGAKQSMDYASFGIFGTPVTGPHVSTAQEEADAAAANAAAMGMIPISYPGDYEGFAGPVEVDTEVDSSGGGGFGGGFGGGGGFGDGFGGGDGADGGGW